MGMRPDRNPLPLRLPHLLPRHQLPALLPAVRQRDRTGLGNPCDQIGRLMMRAPLHPAGQLSNRFGFTVLQVEHGAIQADRPLCRSLDEISDKVPPADLAAIDQSRADEEDRRRPMGSQNRQGKFIIVAIAIVERENGIPVAEIWLFQDRQELGLGKKREVLLQPFELALKLRLTGPEDFFIEGRFGALCRIVADSVVPKNGNGRWRELRNPLQDAGRVEECGQELFLSHGGRQ